MFIVVDGPNGAGKTSLIKSLNQRGYKTLSSPNGTPLAQSLRSACRGTEPYEDIDKRIQFLLFSAARLDEYIRLVHDETDVIVADRWWTSTYVYQCVLQGMELDFLEYTKNPDEKIDMVVLLDAPNDILINRVIKERESNPNHKKCTWTKETKTMENIAEIYRNELPAYLKSKGIPVCPIDTADITIEQVEKRVLEEISLLSE